MKYILKTISFIFCITLFIFVCSCTESAPSTNKYTVTFKDYDGTILREEVIQEGHNATAPTDPERYGYIFVGWDGEYINIQKDTILIAQYKKDESIVFEYTVTFIDYNGTILKEEKVEEGHNATAPSDPEREGYKFIGWNKDYSNVASNLTVIAQYELIKQEETVEKYTVTFVTNSETIIESQEVEEGHKINEPEIPNKKGYNFVGWYDGDEEWNFDRFTVYADTTLIAKYEISIYTIEYDLNNGLLENENPVTYTYFDTYILNNPIKEGYDFVGWSSDEITEPVLELKIENEIGNKFYKANFAPKKYKLNIDPNGGIISSESESGVNYEQLSNITKEGYDFVGWFDNINIVTLNDIVNGVVQEGTTLKAWWINDDYEYIIENNNMYIIMGNYPQTVVTDTIIINELSNITTTNDLGYIEYNGNEYKKIVANTQYIHYKFTNGNEIINGNIYYFKVEPIKWKVIEENDGRYKLLSDTILDISSFYTSYDLRTINGNTIHPCNYEYSDIRAWLNGYDGTYYNVDDYTNRGFIDIAFNKQEQKLIEKTLVDNSINSTNVEENLYLCNNTKDKIYLLSDVELANPLYGFEEQTGSSISRQARVNDYTLCLGIYYSESFNSGCWWGRTPWSREYDCGRSVTYVSYGGTIYPSDIKSPTYKETGVRPALEISIKQSNENIVTFKDYDGTILKEDYVENGQSALPPSDVSKEGYELVGWSKDYTNVQCDLEVYAKYNPIKYTITFDSDGGHLVDDIEFTIETINFILPITKKDGYKFLGWYEDDKLIENIECRNYNLLAKWEKQEIYTVTFDTSGGILNVIDFFAKEFVEDFCIISKETVDRINFKETTPNAIKNFFNKEEVLVEYKWLLEFALSEMKNAAIENDFVNNEYYNDVVELLEKMISLDTTAINGDYANGRTIFRWWLQGLLNSNLAETNYIAYDKFMVDYSNHDNLRRFLVLLQDKENTFKVSKDDKIPDCYKDGYTFLGWYNGENKIEEISSNLTLTAKWEINVYTVVFDEDGGTVINSIEYTVEDETIDLTKDDYIPTKEGYKFLGWYNVDEMIETIEQGSFKDYIFVAKWGKIVGDGLIIYEENGYRYIKLGRYPQTVVTDETVINALSNIKTTNSLGYIEYNGNEYKKLTAFTYESGYKFINGENIIQGNRYYFLVEPIKWRILEENDGTYKLLSSMIIDETKYYRSNLENRVIDEQTIYANNYEYSNIRAWLNGYDGSNYNVEDYTGIGFYDIAFTKEEQELISNTLVDNSLESTGDSSNDYICNNTTDKVYLLSRIESKVDVLNHSYYNTCLSDYARSKNCRMSTNKDNYGEGCWWLRSPENYSSGSATAVVYIVNDFYSTDVDTIYHGVRPAITITIE